MYVMFSPSYWNDKTVVHRFFVFLKLQYILKGTLVQLIA